jgi:hypothetical protein
LPTYKRENVHYRDAARRAEMAGASNDRANSNRSATRRAVVGALGVGVITSLAWCSRSRVDGTVAVNKTPLRLTHGTRHRRRTPERGFSSR